VRDAGTVAAAQAIKAGGVHAPGADSCDVLRKSRTPSVDTLRSDVKSRETGRRSLALAGSRLDGQLAPAFRAIN